MRIKLHNLCFLITVNDINFELQLPVEIADLSFGLAATFCVLNEWKEVEVPGFGTLNVTNQFDVGDIGSLLIAKTFLADYDVDAY